MKSNISVHVPAVGCFVAANLAYPGIPDGTRAQMTSSCRLLDDESGVSNFCHEGKSHSFI